MKRFFLILFLLGAGPLTRQLEAAAPTIVSATIYSASDNGPSSIWLNGVLISAGQNWNGGGSDVLTPAMIAAFNLCGPNVLSASVTDGAGSTGVTWMLRMNWSDGTTTWDWSDPALFDIRIIQAGKSASPVYPADSPVGCDWQHACFVGAETVPSCQIPGWPLAEATLDETTSCPSYLRGRYSAYADAAQLAGAPCPVTACPWVYYKDCYAAVGQNDFWIYRHKFSIGGAACNPTPTPCPMTPTQTPDPCGIQTTVLFADSFAGGSWEGSAVGVVTNPANAIGQDFNEATMTEGNMGIGTVADAPGAVLGNTIIDVTMAVWWRGVGSSSTERLETDFSVDGSTTGLVNPNNVTITPNDYWPTKASWLLPTPPGGWSWAKVNAIRFAVYSLNPGGGPAKDNYVDHIQFEVRNQQYCSPTNTPTFSSTPTRTLTPTPSPSFSASPTASATRTGTPTTTISRTPTGTPTLTATPTLSATSSATPTLTPTLTRSPTPSVTVTSSPTPTLTTTPSPSSTPSLTFSPTQTITFTSTYTATPTPSKTSTPTQTMTRTATLTASASATLTLSPTQSITFTSTFTVTPSPSTTATPTQTVTRTATLTASPSPTFTLSPTQSITFTSTFTITSTPTSSVTPSQTVTLTATLTPSPTPSATPSFTDSPISSATITPTFSPTPTATPTATPTSTFSPTPSASPTGSPTATASPTAIPSWTPTPTITASPSVTALSSPTKTPTVSLTPSISPTFSASATPLPTPPKFKIISVWPNPLPAEGCTIVLSLPWPADLTFKVYDLRGELIWQGRQSYPMGGNYEKFWPAQNTTGSAVSYGAYYLQVSASYGSNTDSAGRWISVVR